MSLYPATKSPHLQGGQDYSPIFVPVDVRLHVRCYGRPLGVHCCGRYAPTLHQQVGEPGLGREDASDGHRLLRLGLVLLVCRPGCPVRSRAGGAHSWTPSAGAVAPMASQGANQRHIADRQADESDGEDDRDLHDHRLPLVAGGDLMSTLGSRRRPSIMRAPPLFSGPPIQCHAVSRSWLTDSVDKALHHIDGVGS